MAEKLTDEFGPAMLALDERRRKFVLAVVWLGKNQTQAAKLAGYATKSEVYSRVQGFRLMRSPRVVAALREEAERRFGASIPLALVGLCDGIGKGSKKDRAAAVDSILDRAGYGRTTRQDIRVEHVDQRSTAELLDAVRRLMPAGAPVIEGAFRTVDDETKTVS